ncbi:nicotinate-nucleotide--dimethylbenzimidazole phosphoribosyltransferase [Ferviditalea candida]|uniref:Nicotinate-nucleotide--dimethylbenzimidazole phosphoribosyltransferase n=1 Tax=Ferviditalea candida TaxID=3108399 RepID=A0ABU5ZHX3_9BACL|nr:nicotinate-nucleotide--dimethylbenzimidazole phosphoribosyltransferase [Paenibacillaceae bacterium T2]
METLLKVLNRIERLDISAMRLMRMRLNNLTKPLGSLGELEDIAVQLAGIQGSPLLKIERKAIVVMCGDHGVTEEGVSAYPAEVTGLMMGNFVRGGAAVNVLARQIGAAVRVVDIGSYLSETPQGIIARKIRSGAGNIAKGPAMTKQEAAEAIGIGIEMAISLADEGFNAIGLGEMGIGNTTPSSAMTAVFTGRPVPELTGKGTGIHDAGLVAKMEVIERAIRVNHPNPIDAIDVIAKVGGLEIAGLVGVILGAASRRLAVVIDGVITGAAALAACRIEPRCRDYMIASHLSVEPAHRIILDELGLQPILHLGMRLGEGSGAALAFPVLESAIRIAHEMATFDDLGLPGPAPELEEYSMPSFAESRASIYQKTEARKLADPALAAASTHAFSAAEKAGVYKAIEQRRDIRSFKSDPVSDELLMRLLRAAHHAPSVGFMQPWNFILITSELTKLRLKQAADKERRALLIHYEGEQAEKFAKLKIEALTEAPITLCVTLDPTRGGLHVLGRNSIPETDLASVACAIQNLWLAARAEGLAVGWVSFYKKQDVRHILGIPPHIEPVALLSIGYTEHFPERPILETAGWRSRLALEELIFTEEWGRK